MIFSHTSLHIICQIFPALRLLFFPNFPCPHLFKALHLFFLPNFPGPMFIPCPTSTSFQNLLKNNLSRFIWCRETKQYKRKKLQLIELLNPATALTLIHWMYFKNISSNVWPRPDQQGQKIKVLFSTSQPARKKLALAAGSSAGLYFIEEAYVFTQMFDPDQTNKARK